MAQIRKLKLVFKRWMVLTSDEFHLSFTFSVCQLFLWEKRRDLLLNFCILKLKSWRQYLRKLKLFLDWNSLSFIVNCFNSLWKDALRSKSFIFADSEKKVDTMQGFTRQITVKCINNVNFKRGNKILNIKFRQPTYEIISKVC